MPLFWRRKPEVKLSKEAITQLQTILAPLLELQSLSDEISESSSKLQQEALTTILQRLSSLYPTIRDGNFAQDHIEKIYQMLLTSKTVEIPPPVIEKLEPGANILLYFDPNLECELRITNPQHPDMYTARLFLPKGYAEVHDNLRYLPNDVRRIALHIDSRKVPPHILKTLEVLCLSDFYASVWLVQRTRISTNEMQSLMWQCTQTWHKPGDSRTIRWPYDYIFFFDRNPHKHEENYEVDEKDIPPTIHKEDNLSEDNYEDENIPPVIQEDDHLPHGEG